MMELEGDMPSEGGGADCVNASSIQGAIVFQLGVSAALVT